MIRLDNIARSFGERTLFRGLSWTIPRLARLGLVGPNGAGKTTLLRILTGAETPDEGSVDRPPALHVGYLPQEVETVADGTVLEVALGGNRELTTLERRIEESERRLGACRAGDPEAAELAARYGELRDRFEALGGDLRESRAKAILGGLGLPVDSFDRPLRTLSGGWRMRVALARLLIDAPDLLLLDEPTNHLDLDAIDWLERFLGEYPGAFVVISHDRYFLNRMVRGIVELRLGALTPYPGNYDTYVEVVEQRRAALEQRAKQQQREIAKVERFIERFRYKNTKARQVQSRIRALEKVDRVRTERRSRAIRFGFPEAPRSGEIVVRLEGVGKRFGERVVYDALDLLLRRGTRLALVGPNGAGKTTLLRLLGGLVEPDVGRVEPGHNVLSHYYAQHQLEALDSRRSVLEEIEHSTPPGERPRLRKLLGRFLFSGDDVAKRVAVLSGGEKARLALAKVLIQPANLLLLDEPTNHLDLQSREVLEEALNEYAGTLVLVSHDRYFINRVATSGGEVGPRRVELYPGDYDEYLAVRRFPAPPATDAAADPPTDRDMRREERRRDAEERNRRYRERRRVEERLEPVERRIADLEGRLGEIERLQTDPAVYRDPLRAGEVGREKLEIESALESAYGAWEALAAKLDTD